MSELHKTVSLVNRELPAFDLRIYRPYDMRRTQASNCLGRAMLAYTILRDMGAPEQAMSLLVDDAHGHQYEPGKGWLGHASLLVMTERGGLVDSAQEAYARDASAVLLLPTEQAGPKCIVDNRLHTMYPVDEGVIAYQETHPLLEEPIVTAQDYRDVYAGLLAASMYI